MPDRMLYLVTVTVSSDIAVFAASADEARRVAADVSYDALDGCEAHVGTPQVITRRSDLKQVTGCREDDLVYTDQDEDITLLDALTESNRTRRAAAMAARQMTLFTTSEGGGGDD